MTDNDFDGDHDSDHDGDLDSGLADRLADDGERWRDDEPADRDLAAFLPAATRGSRLARRSGTWARRAPWLVAAAVVVLAAGVLVPLAAGTSDRQAAPPPAPSVAPACPASLATDVDPLPAGDAVDTGDRLVPEQVPTAMLICRYAPWRYGSDGSRNTAIELDSTATVTAGLMGVTASLRTAVRTEDEKGCWETGKNPSMGATTTYLVALSYGDRVMWLEDSTGAPGCADARNASFSVDGSYGDRFATALDDGSWGDGSQVTGSVDGTPSPLACPSVLDRSLRVPSRPSVDTGDALVPDRMPTDVVMCRYPMLARGSGEPLVRLEDDARLGGDFAAMVADLRQDVATVQPTGCAGTGSEYLMGLEYPDGFVWVASSLGDGTCDLATNGSVTVGSSFAFEIQHAIDGDPWRGTEAVPRTFPSSSQPKIRRRPRRPSSARRQFRFPV